MDLRPRTRVLFAAVYLVAQVALIATASSRPEAAFGFRMFSEASRLSIHLRRGVRATAGKGDGPTAVVDVDNGAWNARDALGVVRRFRFSDRVKDARLSTFDVEMAASYGANAQLERLQAALDDVAAHIPDDVETVALVAEVLVRRNGRPPETVRLSSDRRSVATDDGT
jgi:hypothetical protein